MLSEYQVIEISEKLIIKNLTKMEMEIKTVNRLKKFTTYLFGVLGVLSGLMLMYCVFTGETNQRLYIGGSIEFFISTSIFLVLINRWKLN